MWQELKSLFMGDDPAKAMGDEFMGMLRLTREMAELVRPHVFDHLLSLERRRQILELDVEVNRLERAIRRQIVSHLTLQRGQVPYCLALLMLVGHAERVGDYVKNIAEVEQLGGGVLPEGPLREELSDLIAISHRLLEETPDILSKQDHERADELLRIARNANKRSDKLLVELSKSDLSPAQVTSMVLLARFYRRITGHMKNILTSVVMPVHNLDYFADELGQDEQ
ncbi:MAG: PhoU domain-containing protein [Planctomycetota bacterium]